MGLFIQPDNVLRHEPYNPGLGNTGNGAQSRQAGSNVQKMGTHARTRLHIVQAKIDSVSTKTPRELAGQISFTCFIIGNGQADCTHNFYIDTGLMLMHANFLSL